MVGVNLQKLYVFLSLLSNIVTGGGSKKPIETWSSQKLKEVFKRPLNDDCVDTITCGDDIFVAKCVICDPRFFYCKAPGATPLEQNCSPGFLFNPVPAYPNCVLASNCPYYPPWTIPITTETPGPTIMTTESSCVDTVTCESQLFVAKCNYCDPRYFYCKAPGAPALEELCAPGLVFNTDPRFSKCIPEAYCPYHPPWTTLSTTLTTTVTTNPSTSTTTTTSATTSTSTPTTTSPTMPSTTTTTTSTPTITVTATPSTTTPSTTTHASTPTDTTSTTTEGMTTPTTTTNSATSMTSTTTTPTALSTTTTANTIPTTTTSETPITTSSTTSTSTTTITTSMTLSTTTTPISTETTTTTTPTVTTTKITTSSATSVPTTTNTPTTTGSAASTTNPTTETSSISTESITSTYTSNAPTTTTDCIDTWNCTEVGLFRKCVSCNKKYFLCNDEESPATEEECDEGLLFNPDPLYPHCLSEYNCPYHPE